MRYIKALSAAALVLSLCGCEKMSYFQVNPNAPTVADPSLEFSNIEQIAFNTISTDAGLASRQLVYTQSASLAQYYGWQRGSMSYGNISQVVKMQQEAVRTGKMSYYYLGKFFTDYFIIGMTETFGDIPYSQMMQSMADNNYDSSATRPVYDLQHDVYLGVLNDLKIASDSLIDNGDALEGDLIYGGNITQWKQLINSFTLRVLMSLSLKTSDATLNIQQRFSNIVSNPTAYPLMGSNNDNGALPFYNITGNQYPDYNNNSLKTDFYLDSSFVHLLQGLNDPRLFVYGEPTPNAAAANLPSTDFNAYGGLWGSGDLSYNITKRGDGEASAINNRYAYDPINEPSLLMGYSELQFILAEAVVRGWISGSANTYYMNGIQASLAFSDYNTTYSAADIQNYVGQPSVTLQNSTAIQQIITQKYISMFMNVGWQPFYEYLRTGYPTLEVTGTGIINQVNGVNAVPKRWMYPLDEYTNNPTNVQNAVTRQFPGGDNVNGVMWLLQP